MIRDIKSSGGIKDEQRLVRRCSQGRRAEADLLEDKLENDLGPREVDALRDTRPHIAADRLHHKLRLHLSHALSTGPAHEDACKTNSMRKKMK